MSTRSIPIVIAALWCAGWCAGVPVRAQTTPTAVALPQAADLQRAARTLPDVRALDAIASQSPGPSGVDLQDMARQYQRQRRSDGGPQDGDPSQRMAAGVLLFASLGMSDAALDRMIDDSVRLRAPIVLRGVMAGSLARSKQRIEALMRQRQASWQIDPMLFRRFEVAAVPALVLVDPSRPVRVDCGAALCQQPSFAKVTGDVSAGYALDAIARQDPSHAALAKRFLAAAARK